VTSASLTLVPSWRLGSLLSEARDRHGRTVDRLAACTDRFTAADLIAIEAGERALDDRDLEAVVALYGIDPGALVPGRTDLVVDLDQHRLATAGYTQPLAGTAPTAEEVLASYLALVYTLRHAEPGTKVPLRQADLDVLARALALAEPDIEHRLVDLMVAPTAMVRERTLLLRARVLLPAAGVLLALTVGGAIVVSSRPDQPTPPARTTLVSSPPAGSTTNPSVQLGGAALQARASRPGRSWSPARAMCPPCRPERWVWVMPRWPSTTRTGRSSRRIARVSRPTRGPRCPHPDELTRLAPPEWLA
jgi:hypothetical protein